MSTKKLRVKLYRDVPAGTIFRILKERRMVPGSLGKTPVTPPSGWFVKHRNGVATLFSKPGDSIIPGFSDVVDVIAYPSEKRSLAASVG